MHTYHKCIEPSVTTQDEDWFCKTNLEASHTNRQNKTQEPRMSFFGFHIQAHTFDSFSEGQAAPWELR